MTGGIGPEMVRGGGSGTGVLEEALSTNGCRGRNSSCDLDMFTGHKGGNKLHNFCADSRPQDSIGWTQGTPYSSGNDIVVGGVCFDRAHYEDPGKKTGVVLGEAKTGRLRRRRQDGSRICASKQERILQGVFATLYKELPIAAGCGYKYVLVLGDQDMEYALEQLQRAPTDNPEEGGAQGWVHLGQVTGDATKHGEWRTRFLLYKSLGIPDDEVPKFDALFLGMNFSFGYDPPCDEPKNGI